MVVAFDIMSLTLFIFLTILAIGILGSLLYSPFWGLLICLLVYFINPGFHWWGKDLQFHNWSMLTSAITFISYMVHKDKINSVQVFSTQYMIIVIFFIVSCVISTYAVDKEANFNRCYDIFTYLITSYFFIKCITTKEDVISIMTTILLLGAILGIEALSVQRFGGRLEGVGPSDANDANNFSLLMASIVPLAIPCIFISNNTWYRFLISSCVALIVNGIILANSRGAIIALGVGIGLMLPFWWSTRSKKKIIILLLVGALGFAYLADAVFWQRFETVENVETDKGSGRLDIWKYGISLYEEHPFGVGGDGFRKLSKYYIPDKLLSNGERVPHNTFLLILTEQGPIGLMLFLVIIMSCVRDLLKSAKNITDKSRQEYMLIIGLLGSIICSVVGSFFNDRLYYEFFFVLISLIIVVNYHLVQNE